MKNPSLASTAASWRPWLGLSMLLLAGAMAIIDATAANVALVSLADPQGLGASIGTLSWFISGYMVAFTIALVPGGRLGDRYGHKRVFLVGVVLFMVTGALTVLAPTETLVSLSRVLHGLSAGLMVAPIFALIQLMFTGTLRVRAIAYYTAMTGVAGLVGPLAGGMAIDAIGTADGWRLALAVGLFLGLIILPLAPGLLPAHEQGRRDRFDLVGMLLLTGMIAAAMTPLLETTSGTLPIWAWAFFTVAILLAILFVAWEQRLERAGRHALIPPRLFINRQFSLNLMTVMLVFTTIGTAIYIALAVLWQNGRGESAFAAAVVALPFSVGAILGATVSDRIALACGRLVVPVSILTLIAGYAWTWWLLSSDPAVTIAALVAPLALAGIGSGICIGPLFAAALLHVPERDAGSAAGTLVASQFFGTSLGSAVTIIILSQPDADGAFTPAQVTEMGILAVLACVAFSVLALAVSLGASMQSKHDRAMRDH